MRTFDYELAKGEGRIASLEIAELTWKAHKNVMQAIKSVRPAWRKVAGRNFALRSYRDKRNPFCQFPDPQSPKGGLLPQGKM